MSDHTLPSEDLSEYWLRLWSTFSAPIQSLASSPISHAFLQQSNDAINKATEYWMQRPEELATGSSEWLASFAQLSSQIDTTNPDLNELQQAVRHSQRLVAEKVRDLIDRTDNLSSQEKKLLRFNLRQLAAMVDPRNSFCASPDLISEAQATEGVSLLKGGEKYQQDLGASRFGLQIKRSNADELKLGEHIAATPGEVVYQTDLLQLIHYKSRTEEQFEIPLLLIPPCINRFYVLDLQPETSMVKWLLEQGYDVFMVSWRNPDRTLSNKGFDDYLDSILATIQVVTEVSDTEKLNLAGYCIGGLMAALSSATFQGQRQVNSLALLTTLLDYSEPGELELFTTEVMLEAILTQVAEDGLLDADLMSTVFTFLKEEQLFWKYVRNRYFLGEDAESNALVLWGQDATHLPAKMTEDYLRGFYLDNQLVAEGGYQYGEQCIQLADSRCPKFVLACQSDHITPPASVLDSAELLAGDIQIIQASGGHTSGVINSPAFNRGSYQVAGGSCETDISSEIKQGSWWPEWENWLSELSGSRVKGKICAPAKFPSLEAAPGSYVRAS